MKKRKAENLTNQKPCATIGEDGEATRWISCPACGHDRFLEVPLSARAYRMPVYCKRCRQWPKIDID